jgi:integrase
MNGELSVRRIETLSGPGRHRVAPNLFLFIHGQRRKSWLFIYVCPLNGRSHEMGLGPATLVTPVAAKAAALQHRMAVFAKRCPLCERQDKAAPAKRITFGEVARHYIVAHQASWRSPKHRQAWGRLEIDAAPIWKRAVDAIDTCAVMLVLEPGWSEKAVSLARVRGRIESIMDFARARNWRSGENPARWRGHLDQLLPRPKKLKPVEHLASLPWQDAPAFWSALDGRSGLPALALKLIALTAVRRSEALEAAWSEIDREAAVWTIPAARTKANREHRVPLSPPALRLIDTLAGFRRDDGLLVPGWRRGRPLSGSELFNLMRELRPDATVHGLRSTFRSWAAEQADTRQDIAEAALGHVIANKVVAAYQRNDLFNLRTELMARWAHYLTTGDGS